MAQSRHLNESLPTVLLDISGMTQEVLARQSLRNPWYAPEHGCSQCLAKVDFLCSDLRDDVLERLTWALMAWPSINRVALYDLRSQRHVANVNRCDGGEAIREIKKYSWHADWLISDGESVDSAEVSLSEPGVLEFPPAPARKGGRILWSASSVFRLDESALAQRERVQQFAVQLLGRHITNALYREVQRFTAALRRVTEPVCQVMHEATYALNRLRSHRAVPNKPKFRVLIALRCLSPGGAEKSAIDLAAALVRHGVAVSMVTTFACSNSWSQMAAKTGAKIVDLPDFLPRGCWLRFIQSYLIRNSIDVLHINNSHWIYDNLAALKSAMPELIVVSQIHAEGEPGTLDYPTLASREDRFIDRHSVISEYLADYLIEKHGLDGAKVEVVRTGIDIAREFEPAHFVRGDWRRRHSVDSDTPIVAFVGRLSDLKRPLIFLSVAALVLRERPDTLFVLKGDGPLRLAVQKRLGSDESLRNAVILEDSREPVAPLMVDADLLLLTSAMEGIAYVSYEAMALGLVQVSADVGAQSELITPECGALVATGKGEEVRFARSVCALLADRERRAQMARQGRSRLLLWPTVDDMATSYINIYQSLHDDRSSRDTTEMIAQKRGMV